MGGDVGVRSEIGKGSTFWVRVKVDVVKQQPARTPIGLGRRILIVDDLRAGREALALKLKLYGFETVSVGSVPRPWKSWPRIRASIWCWPMS